jgi:ribonucleoside-triphosphate reductase (formate)
MDEHEHAESPLEPRPVEGTYDAQLSFEAPYIAAPQPICTIIKRDGREAPFDRGKITQAIYKAAQAFGGEDLDRAESLAAGVTLYLNKRLNGAPPTVEQVSDAVEKVLIELGHAQTALAYARYRDKRSRIRQLRQGDIQFLLQELDEANREILASSQAGSAGLFVRTSDERLAGWDRERIVDALRRETGMAEGLARVIAIDVENQVQAANVTTLTAPLVREMVDAKLVERGLDAYRRKHMRLGVPLYDAERIICMPNQGETEGTQDPAATDLALAERVKKEFALTQVFSQEVADAHLHGDLQLADLGFIDRLHGGVHSIEFVKRFGIELTGAPRYPRPPRTPEELFWQMAQFHAALRRHTAGFVGWGAANVLAAPFLAHAEGNELQAAARAILNAFPQSGNVRGGGRAAAELELHWAVPPHLRDAEAIGPAGEPTGQTYAEYEHVAQQLMNAVLDQSREGSWGAFVAHGPCLALAINAEVLAGLHGEDFLHKILEDPVLRTAVHFVFDRAPESAGFWNDWRPHELAVHKVIINLPRAAYRAEQTDQLWPELARLAGLAARAHAEKARFLERLLGMKDLGPFSLLGFEREGFRYLDLETAEFYIAVTGLNECVQHLTGRQLHETDEARALGSQILQQIAALCGEHAQSESLRLTVAQSRAERVCGRFASLDLQQFPNQASAVLKHDAITQDILYTPGVRLTATADMPAIDRVRYEGLFHEAAPRGALTRVRLPDGDASPSALSGFIRKTVDQTRNRRIVFDV